MRSLDNSSFVSSLQEALIQYSVTMRELEYAERIVVITVGREICIQGSKSQNRTVSKGGVEGVRRMNEARSEPEIKINFPILYV
jgi:hypothetical protein